MTYPPYTPATLGRELGIMFAFVGACAVTMAVYSFFWRGHQRRQNDQDRAHRRAFQARAGAALFERAADPDSGGLHLGMTVTVTGGNGHGPVHEKMLDRYGGPVDRVELPVHGDGMGGRMGRESGLL